ncbi:MAG: M1 family metallopeptidase [Chlorobi bacterium]|nr:M1 family metallopeptidase [Chlorobiota bacterium]
MNLRHILIVLFALSATISGSGQELSFISKQKETKKVYKGEKRKINDLIHTDLKVRFDLQAHTMDGEAEITLKPHFYPTDSLTLDAKKMLIHRVKVDGKPVSYEYDGAKLRIRLPRTYTRDQTYKVYVAYTARPDSVKTPGGRAITDHKGLYFINTRGETNRYPPMIWTQGEPEDNSVWFPTIDSPNQKSTQRIEMTVPSDWVTLSNGLMTASHPAGDSLRTDVWEMKKPHAPYLFFMAAGPFAIVRDSLGDMPVWYYVEKPYASVAKDIFGKTPEMIRYFSRLTGVPYPWDKYHQIVTRKFVSGAMENTGAVNHNAMAYQTPGQLADENIWEDVIAHELFHHWFGDYVTAESWAQIPMNEAFADYAESLWEENDEGRDKADYILYRQRRAYLLNPEAARKNLIRFDYDTPDDMFDVVSYQKGGAVLHMLRHYVGDSAFFAGMKRYLETNRFGTGEAEQFRLALEEVSGMDLKPFFDQWFYGSGHPRLKILHDYDPDTQEAEVRIIQRTDKIWHFPLQIDIYKDGKARSHMVEVDDSIEIFRFPAPEKPDFVNVGARHILLAQIDDRRSPETYYYQYYHAPRYMDRRMGLSMALRNSESEKAWNVIVTALDDPFYELRRDAVFGIDPESPYFTKKIEKKLYRMALSDPDNRVRAAAIKKLGQLRKEKYGPLFKEALTSPSASIKEAAFEALRSINEEAAAALITPELERELVYPVMAVYVKHKRPDKMLFVARHLTDRWTVLFTNPEGGKTLKAAMEWIGSSDNLEANRILADNLYGFVYELPYKGMEQLGIHWINTLIDYQTRRNKEGRNREEIIKYYRQILEKLKNRHAG